MRDEVMGEVGLGYVGWCRECGCKKVLSCW